MSLGIYPVFDQKNFQRSYNADGVFIAEALDWFCDHPPPDHIRPLEDFAGKAPTFIPEDYAGNPEDLELPPEQWRWFDAAEGLKTVQFLMAQVEQSVHELNTLTNAFELTAELRELELALLQADKCGVRFLLAIG